MKILVILTGGTIACNIIDNCINANSKTAYEIINLYMSKNPNCNIQFDVQQPFTILSENYTSETYNMLINFLNKIDFSTYDGVIITHGSDTLSYTSAMIGMLLNFINIPILLTASDYPLSDKRSNGLSNFSACVEFIKNNICSGVFTSYGKKDNPNIYLSTRICEADPINDDFTPFGNGIISNIKNNKLSYINNSLINTIKKDREKFIINPVITENVLLIKTFPNQNFNCYNIKDISAVVIYMYHSATACIEGKNTNIQSFINRCINNNTDVYLASFKNIENEYITSKTIEKQHINRLYNISKESAYIKSLLAYNQSDYKPKYIMNKNIYFENC